MNQKSIDPKLKETLLEAQKNERTEYVIYKKLSDWVKDKNNRDVFLKIAQEENDHADFWQNQVGETIEPNRVKIFLYILIAKVLGITFGVKLMELGEKRAQINYTEIAKVIPEAAKIAQEENEHERKLLDMLGEEKLKYVGSMVLGLSDALVELTGVLAGLTLALQNTRLIGVTGLITGIAASFSMAASEYLSTKTEKNDQDPVKAALYTGGMYIVTVFLLILPYFLIHNLYLALLTTLSGALLIIFAFTFYTSIAQDLPFKKRFVEMAGLSLGVAALTFAIGYVVRTLLGVEV